VLANLGKRSEAEEQVRRALAIYERLATIFPVVPDYRLGSARAHNNLGNLLSEQGKRSEAEDQYRMALTIQEKLATDFPTSPEYRVYLALFRAHAGLETEAIADVALLAKSSDRPATDWYNFARVYALAGGKSTQKKREYTDRAMEMLNKAVQTGYKNAEEMKQDKDLDSLRNRDDFKKLLAELTASKDAAGPGPPTSKR
jgi:tetratricopeptide (TPR) repeat protein